MMKDTPQETWINFNPAWISNHIPSKMLDEITYPFLNFNGCTIKVWELWFQPTLYAQNYLSMQGLKLIQVSEAGPGHFFSILLMDGSELTQEGQVVYLTHKNYGASSESIKSACLWMILMVLSAVSLHQNTLQRKLSILMLFVYTYHQTYNINHTLVGNKIVDHSGVVGALPVGTAPTTPSFSTYNTWIQWIG